MEEPCLCSTQEGYSKFQETGLIEWRQKKKPKKIPKPKIPAPPPQKKKNPMPNFRALKVYRKQNKFDCTLFAELRDRDTRALPRNFRLF